MPTSEVIKQVHKIDSELFQDSADGDWPSTPEEEWDDVRGEKSSRSLGEAIGRGDAIPPVRIQHRTNPRGNFAQPELWDGHHRLAEFEAAGHSEIPVNESFDQYERGDGYSGDPYWSSRERMTHD